MPLIKKTVGEIEDTWIALSDEDTYSDDQAIIVSAARFLEERVSLLQSGNLLGIQVDADAPLPEAIVDALEQIALIVVDVPVYTDGRAYSVARTLRQQHHYTGEIRAQGDIRSDQVAFMLRVGFDSFAINEGLPVSSAIGAINAFSVHYQNDTDHFQPQGVWRFNRQTEGSVRA